MKNKIKAWLLEGGFPLEMKFTNSLLTGGFEVAQSVYYKDIESGKYREIDIIATKYIFAKGIWFHITFIVECKKSNDKPWVVLKNKGLLNSIESQLPVYYTKNADKFISASKEEEFKSDLLFKNSRNIGYSVQTAFNKGVDKSYESIQSVTKACEYFSGKLNERKNVCAFYFPLILVEGQIFEAHYTNGDINIEAVDSTEILITRSFHEHGNAHILLFNNSDLKSIVVKLNQLSTDFLSNYSNLLIKHIVPEVDYRAYG